MKVRETIETGLYKTGQGFISKQKISNEIIDIPYIPKDNIDWSWWEADETVKNDDSLDMLIVVRYFPADWDSDLCEDGKEVAIYTAWQNELFPEE